LSPVFGKFVGPFVSGKSISGVGMQNIQLTGHSLTLEQVESIALGSSSTHQISLADSALVKVQASREHIEAVLKSGETVYGVNTGFGAMSSVTIALEDVETLQVNLVRSHAAGTGHPLNRTQVRAMILLRANTLAKGVSGVRPEVIQRLCDLLNHDLIPVIPSQGSLGASGDLAPLAHLALVLMGEGEVWQDGQNTCGDKLTGMAALKRCGLPPLTLKAKEGLALLNGTQMMTAIGTLALLEAERTLFFAELAGAMTIEAVKGSHKPFDDRIAQVRPHPGHLESARVARTLLQGSEIAVSHAHCSKVQDPYSLRCIPQVHGASRDALNYVKSVLSREINAATDNPLIFEHGQTCDVISQGNFHGQPVSMALDFLAIAIAELASLSERRIDKLMNPVFSGLPAFLVGSAQEGLHSGLMIIHYTAASLVSENKILCHPACVDTIPTSNDKEDHVSMGATAARKALKVLEHTQWVIAAELFCAAQGLEHREGLQPGQGVWEAYQLIRQEVDPVQGDRVFAPDIEAVKRLMTHGALKTLLLKYFELSRIDS
jgi:histidine ammonia-lyase